MSKAKSVSSKVLVTSYERLAQRVNAQLREPKAQLAQRCTVRRLEGDFEEDWEKLTDEVQESGMVQVRQDGDDVTFIWSRPTGDE
ncbi:DUF1654 domain-containing protein [Pseudomonas oryzihabitans]|uniref:DUF1654 domain-containing protein n=1 Tax=Pseudomonas oryzihabitans TaxID=47885 RepID=UPI001642BFB2|nr:DUF1654 domain-containing protein [Pseudomonas psychrotolerans]